MLKNLSSLVSILVDRAKKEPDSAAYTFLDGDANVNEILSNEILHKNASAISYVIKEKTTKTEKVALLLDKNIHFVCSLFGIFYSGAIAIPFAAPDVQRLDRFNREYSDLLDDSKPSVLLTTKTIFAQLSHEVMKKIQMNNIKIIFYEDIDASKIPQLEIVEPNIDALALVQYTSAYSAKAKAILYRHADIVRYLERMQHSFDLTKEDRALSYLPSHHYMGLFYGVLQPFYTGMAAYLYRKIGVKFDVNLWLKSISKYRITFTGGPEFAYALASSEKLASGKNSLDLSSWQTAYIGAQVIRKEVLDHFSHRYEVFGFKRTAFIPCYGMAEAPLISAEKINDYETTAIISSGSAIDGIEFEILDPSTGRLCKEGILGEICFTDNDDEGFVWKAGASASIYSDQLASKSDSTYFRTGDVGYQKNGRLYVYGKTSEIDLNHSTAFFTDQALSHAANSIESKPEKQKDPIAVVGMAALFPQSDSCAEFWDNLDQGKDLISEIPENRWNWQAIYGNPDNESQITDIKWGGFINDVKTFDASFFNISPKEAQLMDPMQRKLIQTVWQSVEDAGYRMSDLSGKRVGVFVGIGTFDYLQLVLENNKFTHAYASTGIVHCMASNRISYLFDFKGPSESVDTACSSSLVALHRAMSLMNNNECEMAIVCGANILLSSSVYVALSNAGMLSKTGKCRTFDDSADGYVRGEGIAAIILKKLHDAEVSKDHIYGLLKGAAVNHGGHTSSLTAPNPFAQSKVIEASLKDAGFDASTLTYIETHGTATALGDPIEISGLTSAFENASRDINQYQSPYCALGSVKTNIGHLEAAAGIASVIKVLLSMRHKKIPAHLHLKSPNKNIHLDETPFYFTGDTSTWNTLTDKAGNPVPRRAGVSSFGFGGVNAHVTLEEYTDQSEGLIVKYNKNAFVFSAKTQEALNDYLASYCEFIALNEETINLENMAYTLQCGRESFDFRLAIVASSAKELLEKLKSVYKREPKATNELEGVYFSKIQTLLSNVIFKTDRDNVRKLQEVYIENNDVDALAQLWMLGDDIDWEGMYSSRAVQRMSLPTYPFEKTVHWIDKVDSKEKISALIKDSYDVNWYEEPVKNDSEDNDFDYVIFCDRQPIGRRLFYTLQGKGRRVYKIYYDDLEPIEENDYIVEPENIESYLDVLKTIAKLSPNRKLKLINLWPLDFISVDEPSLNTLKSDYQFVCKTALLQLQALKQLEKMFIAHLWIVTNNVQAVKNHTINLNSAPLWGMARTLVLEEPALFRSIIDIDLNITTVDSLINEISAQTDEGEIVYRDNIRYVPRMEAVQVKKSTGKSIDKKAEYLVTGGLGSLGLLVAEWLSSLNVEKVYLLSRRKAEETKHFALIQESIRRIEARGTKVKILQADVTDLDQMQAIADAHFDVETLKGVFHLAGSYQESLLSDMSFDEFKQVVSAKVEGTWVLHELFKAYSLDRFLMFSSGASIWGAATGGHYSAGNYFLDAYAEYGEAKEFPSMSISWGGLWKASGIIPENKEAYFKSIGVKETSPEEGVQQMASIIDSHDYKKVIAPIDWPLFLEVMNAQRKKPLFNNLKLIDKKKSGDNCKNEFLEKINQKDSEKSRAELIVNELAQLIKSILSINEVEEDTGFFNLGLDSLASIDLKNRINKTMGVNISTTTLFDCNTLRLLSSFLLENYFQIEAEKPVDVENKEFVETSSLENLDKNELLKFLELELETK